MAWHPKFIDGRVDIVNGEKSTIIVYSTIDSDSKIVPIPNGQRIFKAFWNDDGLCAQTEDGKTIRIICERHTYRDFNEMIRQSWGHEFISIEEGEKIRRYEAFQKRINEKYDIVIHWSCYDTDARYNDEILSSIVFQQKQLIKRTIESARQGDAIAQNEVGRYYQNGIGVAKDDAEAVTWYRMAAEQGNLDAQDNLGWMYQHGLGVAQDETEAVKWYRMASEQGHAYAQNNLGWMYQNGWGVEKNESEAVKWYLKAAEQGNLDAQDNLGWMYQHGLGVAQDETEAVKWYRMASEQGHANAQNSLGWMYQNGWGVAQDMAEAVKWYRKAAEQGNSYARKNLEALTQ